MISNDIFLKRLKPLVIFKEHIILSRISRILISDIYVKKINSVVELPISLWKKILSNLSFFVRLLRLEIKCATYYQGLCIAVFENKIFSINIKSKCYKIEHFIQRGSGPLQITNVENVKNFNDGVYFGEYYFNPKMHEVKIFYRDSYGHWNAVFSFPSMQINHIHGIFPDKVNACLWILTGDTDSASAIWKAENMFQKVSCIVSGSQIYRACFTFPTNEGLLYATDSPNNNNSIRLLYERDGNWKTKKIIEINGPCLYGCKLKDFFVFSTTVEPIERTSSFLHHLISFERAKGIKDSKSHIIIGNTSLDFQIIESKKKDRLPYALFQFGTIKFPAGENNSNILFSYSVGNIETDLGTEVRFM